MNYTSIKKKFFSINHFFHLSSNRTWLKMIIRIDFEDIIKGKKITLL